MEMENAFTNTTNESKPLEGMLPEGVAEAAEDIEEKWGGMLESVERRITDHPLAAVGITAGVAFVLARGLPRFGLLGLLGVGGLVGLGVLKRRRAARDSDIGDSGGPESTDGATNEAPSKRRRRKKNRAQ
jgi:hypothetical protein